MAKISSPDFWEAAAERAVRTICQTMLSMIPAAAMITEVDWRVVVGTAALSGFTSILTSVVAGIPEVKDA